MAEVTIVALTIAALIALSLRANSRFRDAERLPMQWSLTGRVNWTAPRAIALAFTPVLAIGILIATLTMPPRPGQEGLELPILAAIGASLLTAHLFHLWLIDRHLRR